VEDFSDLDGKATTADVSPLEAQILQEAVNASIKLEVSKQIDGVPEGKVKVEIATVEETEKKAKDKESKSDDRSGQKSFNEWLRAPGDQVITQGSETKDEMPGQSTLIDQLQQFPDADHDDGPDTLEILYENALKYSRGGAADLGSIRGAPSDIASDFSDYRM